MSLDQVMLMLADRKFLKDRKKRMDPKATVMLPTSEDGLLVGRATDGSVIRRKVFGKSYARRLMEQAQRERDARRKANDNLRKAGQ